MMTLLMLGGIFVLILVLVGVFAMLTGGDDEGEDTKEKQKTVYKYTAKKFFLTASEHEFYNVLGQAVGKDYRIFAQVHLPTIIEHKIVGQNWKAAFSHINQKSVDFVLCDKDNISPVLAIELDDKSHERPDRVERDIVVERILQQAGVPLLRIEHSRRMDQTNLLAQINALLGNGSIK